MLTLIPTPIGNPQDITIRALRAFEKTNLFLCEDTRKTKHLLKLLEERFEMAYPSDAQFLSFNEHNGKERLKHVGDMLVHKCVSYVSDAGMPVISDPGQLLVDYCQTHNVAYDVLPGASAVTTAYAASGFEAGRFLFYGFLPHKGKERAVALQEAMGNRYDTVLYEAPHRLEKLLTEIVQIDREREIFLAKEISKRYQTYYREKADFLLKEIGSGTIRGEWVVIVKGKAECERTLSLTELKSLELPPKVKAKLLAQVSGKSVKEWYEILSVK